jgi:hypothetical protein
VRLSEKGAFMKMYIFELMQKRNMKKFSPGQQKFLCTMIVEEAKKAAKEHNQDFDTAYYMMAHGLWGGDRLVEVDLPDDGILRF